jgi:circadian clock protein KaiC
METSRTGTGLPGLDEILHGGLPAGRSYLLRGTSGAGKTTFGLRFLLEGARGDERCLLMSNTETPAELDALSRSHGWDLAGVFVAEWENPSATAGEEYTVFSPAEVELEATLSKLFAEIEHKNPQRLVIDSLGAIRMLAHDRALFRRQLQTLCRFLASRECTTLLVDDVGSLDESGMETLVHGVLQLEHFPVVYGGDRRRLRVSKVRASDFTSGYHDFVIRRGGPIVYPRLSAGASEEQLGGELVTSGQRELDVMAGGGLPRGTSTLLLGPSGTGKSALAALYASSAAAHGENVAVYLFDEAPAVWKTRNEGLGIAVGAHTASGRIRLSHLDPAEMSPGEFSRGIADLVETDDVRLVVIDSLNGFLHAMPGETLLPLYLRELLSFLGQRRVLSLLTMSQHGLVGEIGAPLDVSFIADNVILFRYFESAGVVRRAVSIVKKRSGPHEQTVRELRITAEGVHLGEPLARFEGVLAGKSFLPVAGVHDGGGT